MSYDTSVAEQFALLLQRRTRQQVLIAAFGRFALKQIGRPALMQEAARLAAEGLHAAHKGGEVAAAVAAAGVPGPDLLP